MFIGLSRIIKLTSSTGWKSFKG